MPAELAIPYPGGTAGAVVSGTAGGSITAAGAVDWPSTTGQ
jgi:hypothetical protein